MARIQKKEGFIRTPPNRYGPCSSLSNTATDFNYWELFSGLLLPTLFFSE